MGGRGIETWLETKPKARAIRSALVGAHQVRLMWLVALLRLPPNSPFAIANLAMASTGVRLLPFMAGTAIGMTPRTIAAAGIAAAGAATGASDLQALSREQGLLWFGIGIVSVSYTHPKSPQNIRDLFSGLVCGFKNQRDGHTSIIHH